MFDDQHHAGIPADITHWFLAMLPHSIIEKMQY
jgi:hypothetical protein